MWFSFFYFAWHCSQQVDNEDLQVVANCWVQCWDWTFNINFETNREVFKKLRRTKICNLMRTWSIKEDYVGKPQKAAVRWFYGDSSGRWCAGLACAKRFACLLSLFVLLGHCKAKPIGLEPPMSHDCISNIGSTLVLADICIGWHRLSWSISNHWYFTVCNRSNNYLIVSVNNHFLGLF